MPVVGRQSSVVGLRSSVVGQLDEPTDD